MAPFYASDQLKLMRMCCGGDKVQGEQIQEVIKRYRLKETYSQTS